MTKKNISRPLFSYFSWNISNGNSKLLFYIQAKIHVRVRVRNFFINIFTIEVIFIEYFSLPLSSISVFDVLSSLSSIAKSAVAKNEGERLNTIRKHI